MKTSDEAYEEFVTDIIMDYFVKQIEAGRSVIYESEIWQLLGMEIPSNRENRRFILRENVGNPSLEVSNKNVIDFTKYKNKIH